MTRRPVVLIGTALAVLIVAGLVRGAAMRFYFEPAGILRTEITDLTERVQQYDDALSNKARLDRTLADFAQRTLGSESEVVDHRLRTRLNRIAEAVALEDASVGTGNVSRKQTPAKRRFRSRSMRELRDEIDFSELDGWVSGEGTLEQVLKLVHLIEQEPWLKRIDNVKFDPKDDGHRFAVTVRLTTLFFPDRTVEPVAEVVPIAAGFDRYAVLVQGNPFRLPVPEVVVVAPPAPPPAPPAPTFPWGQWMLTGVAEGHDGPEVWLRNVQTGQTERLVIGQGLDVAVLRDVSPDWAEFEVGERRFRVILGGKMNDRTPISQ